MTQQSTSAKNGTRSAPTTREKPSQRDLSMRGKLVIANCRSGADLAKRIVTHYQQQLVDTGSESSILHLNNIDIQFSDSETCVRLNADIGDCDVFLIQALLDPVSKRGVDVNYMAFLIAARTLRQWGANHVTAILPYLAYARQDKATWRQREPVTARLMADLTITAGADRLITWDPHSSQISGFYGSVPVDALDPFSYFVEEFRSFQGRSDVIAVAPDVGASKLVTSVAHALELSSAIASKHRPRPEEAVISEIIGDFTGKRIAIVLDDMISSGGTVYNVINSLVKEKGIEQVVLAVSHNLCLPLAHARLLELHADYHLTKVLVTNSIPQTDEFQQLPFLTVRCLAERLSQAIEHIHRY
ncbi:ribose-phosphate diphosphokinase [Chloroflexi bacterium TSY]|nr:ribose-phosphate diphosphokinase [Chloroflexi bacterium TSY]